MMKVPALSQVSFATLNKSFKLPISFPYLWNGEKAFFVPVYNVYLLMIHLLQVHDVFVPYLK